MWQKEITQLRNINTWFIVGNLKDEHRDGLSQQNIREHIPDMAHVRPAGRMRPSNLFLWPLEHFFIWKW